MKCERIKQLLSAYVDNELSGAERKQTEEHLESCPKCSQEAAALTKVANLVSSLPKVSAPYGLAQRVQRQLQKPQPSTEAPWVKFLFRYRWALGGVVTTAAALMIVYINIVLLSKPATVTEPERLTTSKSVVASSTLPPEKARMETGKLEALEKDFASDTLARNKVGLGRLTNAKTGMTVEGLRLKDSGEGSPKTISKKGTSKFIGKDGRAVNELAHKERKQQTIEQTLTQKLELSKLMTQTERRKVSTLLSQKVLVVCLDLDTQISELEKIVKNTLSQIPKAQVIEVTGNIISMLNVPADKQIQSQIIQLKSNINSFRQRQKSKANAPLQIRVSIPLEQKEHLIAQLDRLGHVRVSQLRSSQPGDLSAGKLGLGDLALDLQDQISELTENAEELDRRNYGRSTPAPAQATPDKLAKAPGLLDEQLQTKQRDKNEQALTQIESDTIRLYDLRLQRAVRQKQHARKKGSWDQEDNKEKEDMDRAGSSLTLESQETRGAGQIAQQHKGFTLGRPSQTIMIELIITLEEQTNVSPAGK